MKTSIKLLIFGGRDYGFTIEKTSRHPVIRLKPAEIKALFESLDYIHQTRGVSAVIEGCAPGADTLGGIWAASRGIPIEEFPADWDALGSSAGPVRNKTQLRKGKPDEAARFAGGAGSDNMQALLDEAGIDVWYADLSLSK